MLDALRSYLQLASGLAEVSANKARETATSLVSQTPDAGAMSPDALSSSIQGMAEDLVEQSRTNSEIIVGLVKTEVDRTVGRMGFVREEELAALRRHVQRLETEIGSRSGQAVDAANAAVSAASVGARSATATAKTAASAARGAAKAAPSVAKRTATTKSATAKKSAPATKPAAKTATAKSTAKKATKKTAAKKSAPKKAAKKSSAKKSTAKKATRRK